MFDPSQPMLKKCTTDEELQNLNKLFDEAEAFLVDWDAYEPNDKTQITDAVVALFLLQAEIRQRRAYLLGIRHMQDLPF